MSAIQRYVAMGRLDCKTVRIFAYSRKDERAVKQKVSNEAENWERDWGPTGWGPTGVWASRASRLRLLRHALPISLLILRKKPTVLQSMGRQRVVIVFNSFSSQIAGGF